MNIQLKNMWNCVLCVKERENRHKNGRSTEGRRKYIYIFIRTACATENDWSVLFSKQNSGEKGVIMTRGGMDVGSR